MADKERVNDTHAQWQKEHTVVITMRLQRSTDADLVEAMESSGERNAAFIKRMARLGLVKEQELKRNGGK